MKTNNYFIKTNSNKNKKLAADSSVLIEGCHQPVLVDEIGGLIKNFRNPSNKHFNYLDLTAGNGGHAQLITELIKPDKTVLVDKDPVAIQRLKSKFSTHQVIINDDFVKAVLRLKTDRELFDLIVVDLGISLDQLVDSQRGFSYRRDGPLDMRLNQDEGQSLSEILINISEEKLRTVLKNYGQEKYARILAKLIKEKSPKSTGQLSSLIASVKPRQKKHSARQTFLALRILTNNELDKLRELLKLAPDLLKPGGMLLIISFHSLEDRLVKKAFLNLYWPGYDCQFELLTKKPITPSSKEINSNPLSRSAKLRCLQRKIKTKDGRN